MTSKPAIVGIAGKRMRLDVHVWEQLVSPPGKCVNAHSVREGLNELDHIVLVGFVGTSTLSWSGLWEPQHGAHARAPCPE